jgi:hypothetical protein
VLAKRRLATSAPTSSMGLDKAATSRLGCLQSYEMRLARDGCGIWGGMLILTLAIL